MASSSRASTSATPLRRRTHTLNNRRSSSTASSTIRPDESTDQEADETLPSPPTSLVEEENDTETEQYADDEGDEEQAALPDAGNESEDEIEEYHHRPWYKPSLPVLLPLAASFGNWLTGGDQLKDIALLLLLMFYLHQLVETPWTLYRNARPRRSLSSPITLNHPTTNEARSELRRLELFLLFVCLVAPALGVVLLRTLTSTAPYSSSPTQRQPISWFSTSIFALLTAFRPLRELVSLITTRTSTLHTRIHTGPIENGNGEQSIELVSLRAEVALLSNRLDALSQNLPRKDKAASNPHMNTLINRLDALTVLVSSHSELIPLLEDGVHRLERRVGRLRAGRKAQNNSQQQAGATTNTIFVPAPIRPPFLSWLISPTQAVPSPQSSAAPPLSPSSSKIRTPLGLAPIPEESETMPASFPIRASYRVEHVKPVSKAVPGSQLQPVLDIISNLALAPLQLILLPLYIALLPLRSVLKALVG
ncbi:OTU domain-containing protein [Mycena indigotica]|uniref:OTU domain-containing protein n=1 Tax=Mycena indigotica TaxID=2126181 RepID=A0A8H6WEY5_9AGAR|nr:OTU domain-containing protein [Mycena indigotica]KAF7309954.1 OTU domain-containing protein [Mycena indigotica]